MSLVPRESFELAIDNISALGDTDIFPLPIENHVLHDQKEQVLDLLVGISNNFQQTLTDSGPVNTSALSPVGYNGFRWATQIDPIWNAYLLGLVISLAADIEKVRVPTTEQVVFSYRFDPAGEHLFDRQGWSKFQERSLANAAGCKFVVSLDIADFYGRIYHHRLENELKYVDASGARAQQTMRLLGSFSNGASYGLPIGGPASRILSELLLNDLDKTLLDQEPVFSFVRFADDYRFFVDDMEGAYRAIGFMSEKLQRNEGLSLQRTKTRIMTSAEFLTATEVKDPRPGSAAKFLNMQLYYDPYSATAESDYEHLRESLQEFDVLGLLRAELFKGHVDQALTKKLILALEHMQVSVREQAIRSLLANLETLTPIIPAVMRAIRKNVAELGADARAEVHATIRDLIRDGHHLTRVDMNLAYMVRVLGQEDSEENRRLLSQLFSGPHGYSSGPAPNIQSDITLILGKWRQTHWLHDQLPYYATMHPWVRRAFWISSFALGDAGSHWRKNRVKSLDAFDTIVADWASSRSNLKTGEIPI